MTPKELVDKITLAAEQLESLRTEYDLPPQAELGEGYIAFLTSNKKHLIDITVWSDGLTWYDRHIGSEVETFKTYEELVEDIKNR